MRATAIFPVAAAATLAAGALVAATATAAHGSSTRSQANSQTFTDSTGENAAAPDITTIQVSNDDAGNITFQVNISNRPALTPDMALFMLIDADNNAATGDPQAAGADFLLQLVPGDVALFPWAGTDYGNAAPAASLNYSYGAAGATIHVNASDLGKTRAFNFYTLVFSGITTDASGNPDLTNAVADRAPDNGSYAYQVLTKLVLTSTAFTTAPKPARAGKSFTVGLAANENDTGGPVQSGTVSCSATIAAKTLPAVRRGSLANGIATCIWKIPKTARGKTIRGTITVTVRGVALKKGFSAKIS